MTTNSGSASHIIFLNIDGVMIPRRARYLPENYEGLFIRFDPVAVAMVNRLIKDSGAMIVISSVWRHCKTMSELLAILKLNGFDWRSIHRHIGTTPMTIQGVTRAQEIEKWLFFHPEVVSWVAFDNEPTPKPGGILIDSSAGIGENDYAAARQLLGLDSGMPPRKQQRLS